MFKCTKSSKSIKYKFIASWYIIQYINYIEIMVAALSRPKSLETRTSGLQKGSRRARDLLE
jgi:hypothetical protein